MDASMTAAAEVREQGRLASQPADIPNRGFGRRMLADALRVLAIDAVEAANSGHPGMPMGMADIAEALWRRHLRHNPANPRWPDRDRFVLSNGHGSMLLYGLLHLTGYDLPMDELRRFRRLGSRTPGHPEHGVTPGVETTTGPLGQGIANAVGMALAERLLGAEFNRPGHRIVDHRTFCFAGDGCLMEGISHEACSLAGTLGLEKLVVFYDDNGISIDGHVAGWFADDTPRRFEAYGWRVIRKVDGHDAHALDGAIAEALEPCGRPTLICCRTVIGHGSPARAGTPEVHGAPLGAAEAAATRAALGWTSPPFELPPEVRAAWDARGRGAAVEADWQARFDAYAAAHPQAAAEFLRRLRGDLPDGFDQAADTWTAAAAERAEPVATRKASQQTIGTLAGLLPELLGGSADLTGSTLTDWPGSGGRHLHYGVREFAMAAIMNGIALHGGLIPFGATFLAFSDYARNGLRLSALMGLRVVHVFTHDGIGLGEDGPTHQPVEQAASLRLIPNLDVWRPCDALETAVAWRAAVERADGPTALLLSRQTLPVPSSAQPGPDRARDAARGGYVLADADLPGKIPPDLVLIATGSEVSVALEARRLLAGRGVAARVVSMPCCEAFGRQDPAWRRAVLPDGVPRLAVEAGATGLWRAYVGLDGDVVGLDRYGESAPAGDLYRHFGITAEAVAERARRLRRSRDPQT